MEISDVANGTTCRQNSYAVVMFEDGIEIIKTDWAVREEGNIVASYFPPDISALDLRKLLISKVNSDFDKVSWSNDEGKPYLVEKVYSFATNIEAAEKKKDLYIQLTDVESDENKNSETLKRSRHERCRKRKSDNEDDNTQNLNFEKRKPLRIISNKLFQPTSASASLIHATIASSLNVAGNVPPKKTVPAPTAVSTHTDKHEVAKDVVGNVRLGHTVPVPTAVSTCTGEEEVAEAVAGNVLPDEAFHVPTVNKSTSTNGEEMSGVDSTTTKIFKKLNFLSTMMKSMCENGGKQPSKPNLANKDKSLEILPGKTKQEVLQIEEKLKKKKFYYKVSEAVQQVGISHNINITIYNMLNELITYKAGQEFTYEGRSNIKTSFRLLKINKLIHHAMSIVQPRATKEEIKNGVRKWLHACKMNDRRQQAKIDKQKRREEEETLEMEERPEGVESSGEESESSENDEENRI